MCPSVFRMRTRQFSYQYDIRESATRWYLLSFLFASPIGPFHSFSLFTLCLNGKRIYIYERARGLRRISRLFYQSETTQARGVKNRALSCIRVFAVYMSAYSLRISSALSKYDRYTHITTLKLCFFSPLSMKVFCKTFFFRRYTAYELLKLHGI